MAPGITPRTTHRCEIKDSLTSGWQSAPRLRCDYHRAMSSPNYGDASFHIYFGQILDSPGSNFFVSYSPQDYIGKYVRVWSQWDNEAEVLKFSGFITDQTDHLTRLVNLTGMSKLVAFDMAIILDRQVINSGNCLRNNAAQLISDCPSFNKRPAYGRRVIGNRSKDPYFTNPVDVYVFDEQDEPPDPVQSMQSAWNALQACHHLIFLSLRDLGVEWEFTCPDGFLDQLYDTWDVNGKSIWEALTDILDRRYGICFSFWVDESDVWQFRVDTVTPNAITFGTKSIPANDQQIGVEIPAGLEGHVWAPLQMRISQRTKYDSIIVVGNHAQCMGSFSVAGGNLLPWWSVAQENKYLSPGTADPDEADRRRSREEFDGVFTRFVVPKNWDGSVTDPFGNNAVTLLFKIDPTTGIDLHNFGGFWLGGGKSFERQTFLRRGYDYSGALPVKKRNATDSADEYLPMIAWVYDDKDGDLHSKTNKWIQLDRINEQIEEVHSSLSLRSLDTQLGVELGASPRHLMAVTDWDPEVYKTNVLPEFDWQKLVVTAVVKHDQRIRKKVAIPGSSFIGDFGRTLRIEVDADLWYVAPNTMIDVADNGAPVYYGGPTFLRDQRDVIDMVAAGATAWYGMPRQAVTIPIKRIRQWCRLGNMITSIFGQSLRVPINAVVTSITTNYDTQTETIETGWNSQDYMPDFSRKLGRK